MVGGLPLDTIFWGLSLQDLLYHSNEILEGKERGKERKGKEKEKETKVSTWWTAIYPPNRLIVQIHETNIES